MIKGLKKNVWLKLNSVKARQTTPIVDETNDIKVGNIKKDIVNWTRLRLVLYDELARSQRAMICTEYSTAKPTLKTNDMLENPVKLTPARTLNPTTDINVKIIVIAIKPAPIKLPKKIFRRE
jgi:hypothetical protein